MNVLSDFLVRVQKRSLAVRVKSGTKIAAKNGSK